MPQILCCKRCSGPEGPFRMLQGNSSSRFIPRCSTTCPTARRWSREHSRFWWMAERTLGLGHDACRACFNTSMLLIMRIPGACVADGPGSCRWQRGAPWWSPPLWQQSPSSHLRPQCWHAARSAVVGSAQTLWC